MIYVLHIWTLLVQFLQILPSSVQNIYFIFEGYYIGWLIFQTQQGINNICLYTPFSHVKCHRPASYIFEFTVFAYVLPWFVLHFRQRFESKIPWFKGDIALH